MLMPMTLDILANLAQIVMALAAVAAMLVTFRTAKRSLAEQRLLAHQQFLWDRRSELYSRILVFSRTQITLFNSRTASV